MKKSVYDKLRAIAYDKAGIHLNEGKEALVSARVAKRLRALKLPSAEAYLEYLMADKSGEELVQFLDAISTNFTNFFREPEHFDIFKELIAHKLSKGQKRFRIWCAASSSGEEPYTILISLDEVLGGRSVDVKLLATDISTRVLNKATAGTYGKDRLGPMSSKQVSQYFTKGKNAKGEPEYTIKADLRKGVIYKRLNLAKPPFPMHGPMDAIFCRNVMIYFDNKIKQGLVGEIERLLGDDGLLFIGHSETLSGLQTKLQALKPSVYAADAYDMPGLKPRARRAAHA